MIRFSLQANDNIPKSTFRYPKSIRYFNAFTLLLFLFSSFINANNSKTTVSFCYETWYPYAYIDENNQHTGTNINFIKSALTAANFSINFYEQPHRRCLKKVHAGEIDFALYADTNNKMQLIDYQLASWDLVLAVKKDIETSFETTKHYNSVIISKDYLYSQSIIERLNKMFTHIHKESFYIDKDYDLQKHFKLIDEGIVDAVLIDKNRALTQLEKTKFNVKLSKKPFHSQPQYIGYIKKNSELAQHVHLAIIAHDANLKNRQ